MFGCSTSARNRRSASAAAMASSSPRVDQPLQHDPPVGDLAVASQVDPAETAVGEAARHLVLAGDEVPGRQLGHERERVAAAPAEALRAPGHVAPAAADRLVALAAEPPLLRHVGFGHHRGRRVPGRHRGTSTSPTPRRRGRLTTEPLRDDDAEPMLGGAHGRLGAGERPGPRCRRSGPGGRSRRCRSGRATAGRARPDVPAGRAGAGRRRRTGSHATVVAVAVAGSRPEHPSRWHLMAPPSIPRPAPVSASWYCRTASAATARSIGASKSSSVAWRCSCLETWVLHVAEPAGLGGVGVEPAAELLPLGQQALVLGAHRIDGAALPLDALAPAGEVGRDRPPGTGPAPAR